MNTKFIKWHKHKTLEEIADEIHKGFKCRVPVDIDCMVEKCGIDISDVNRLKEDFNLYGLLAKVKGKFTIFVQKGDLKLTNYHTNFTIAEEFSHFILHEDHFKNVNDFQEAHEFYIKIKQKSEMMMELNAKHLAAAILIPREDIKRRAMKLYNDNKSALVELLKSDSDKIIDSMSSSLSDVYCVPELAVARRLRATAVGFKDFLRDVPKSCPPKSKISKTK